MNEGFHVSRGTLELLPFPLALPFLVRSIFPIGEIISFPPGEQSLFFVYLPPMELSSKGYTNETILPPKLKTTVQNPGTPLGN